MLEDFAAAIAAIPFPVMLAIAFALWVGMMLGYVIAACSRAGE